MRSFELGKCLHRPSLRHTQRLLIVASGFIELWAASLVRCYDG
jgi:hypothetical protein